MRAPLILLLCLTGSSLLATDADPARNQAELDARERVPAGGDFAPDPQVPALVAVGVGGRILFSNDDGVSWEPVFFGAPTTSHGYWVCRSVAYTAGVFAVPIGWGKPPMVLASDDGRNWRHLAAPPDRQTGEEKVDPMDMPGAWTMVGGDGTFIFGAHNLSRTSDFGKSWKLKRLPADFRDDPRKLSTHHFHPHYLGEPGRFLIMAQDRNADGTQVANLFLTEDNGETWQWLETTGLENGDGKPADIVFKDGVWLLSSRQGEIYRSTDEGKTWEGPTKLETGWPSFSIVDGEFWVVGRKSYASKDGIDWRPLPATIPEGVILQTSKGTLLSVGKGRNDVQRSTDGGETWEVVHEFEGAEGAQGLVDIREGLIKAGPDSARVPSEGTPYRTWTATNGDVVEARLLEGNLETATLQTRNGRNLEVPVELLSSEDRQYLRAAN